MEPFRSLPSPLSPRSIFKPSTPSNQPPQINPTQTNLNSSLHSTSQPPPPPLPRTRGRKFLSRDCLGIVDHLLNF
ncbi:hypothetical protein EAF00_000751 [Botryotinia globosa]|nr:hypothetical protein EAF00_000751 [Botryotinia globosa]